MEERKKNVACSMLEYLDWYIKHESDCFIYHDESAQVSIFCNEFSRKLISQVYTVRKLITEGKAVKY